MISYLTGFITRPILRPFRALEGMQLEHIMNPDAWTQSWRFMREENRNTEKNYKRVEGWGKVSYMVSGLNLMIRLIKESIRSGKALLAVRP